MMELNSTPASHRSSQPTVPDFESVVNDITDAVTTRYKTWQEWAEVGKSIQEERDQVHAKWQEASARQDHRTSALWEVKLHELSWRIEEHRRHEPTRRG